MDNPILNQINDAATATKAKAQDFVSGVEANLVASDSASKLIQEATATQGAANLIINAQSQAAELKAQNAIIDTREAAGGTKFEQSLIFDYNDTVRELISAQDEVEAIYDTDRTGIGAIDYVLNFFAATSAEGDVERAQGRLNNLGSSISGISDNLESFKQAENSTKRAITTDTIAATQKAITAESVKLQSKAELDSIAINSEALSKVMQANTMQLDTLLKISSAENEQERMKQSREQFKLSKASMQLQLEQYQDNKIAREEVKATESMLVNAIQIKQAKSGMAPQEDRVILWGLKQGGAVGKQYADIAIASLRDDNYSSPSQAAKDLTLVTGGNLPKNIVTELYMEAQTGLDSDGVTYKTVEEYEAAFDVKAKALMENYGKSIKTGDSSNPLHGAPLKVLADNSVAIQEQTFYKRSLAPRDMKELSPERIVAAALSDIDAGLVTPEEVAKGITTIFSVARAHNTETNMYGRGGLETSDAYNVEFTEQSFAKGVANQIFGSALSGSIKAAANITGLNKLVPTAPQKRIYNLKSNSDVQLLLQSALAGKVVIRGEETKAKPDKAKGETGGGF